MTPEELVRAVRLEFIEHDRSDALPAKLSPERRREWAVAARMQRARRRKVFKSPALRNVAVGYLAACDAGAVKAIYDLISWLAILPLVTNAEGMTPQQLVSRVEEQQRLRLSHVMRLREIAATVTENYACRLKELADEVENDRLALFGTEVGVWMVGNPKNVGQSGSAAVNAAGAWRGWLIRELHTRLPDLDLIPQPFSTISVLLTWAGIDGMNSMLVRSILKRGRP